MELSSSTTSQSNASSFALKNVSLATSQYVIDIDDVPEVNQLLRHTFLKGHTLSYDWRISQLKQLKKMMEENREEIIQAVQKDLGKKHPQEVIVTEVNIPLTELDHLISSLYSWMQPESVSTCIAAQPASSYIYSDPQGVVLIMSPWNYPVNLALVPLMGAIAGGNTVLLKVSAHSGNTAETLKKLLDKYMDPLAIRVEGKQGSKMITKLLEQKWDHIFFTGSVSVGKIVYQAAAKNLTKCTLELGGKNPCIVDKDVDIDLAAKRIAWGKFFNAGQTCITADYLLVHKEVVDPLIEHLKKHITSFYGEDPQSSVCFPRIISTHHVQRLAKLFQDGEVVFGGKVDENDRYCAPTIIKNPKLDAPIMTDEIFGPVLPIIPITDVEEAIQFINERPYPLALYYFGRNSKAQDEVIARTRSGASVMNDLLVHFTNSSLPFGGVGESGLGAYHGKLTFDCFVHKKAVMKSTTRKMLDVPLRYPPYSDQVSWIVDKVSRSGW